MALSAAAHHSFDKVAAGVTHDSQRAQTTDRAEEAAHRAPRRQRTRAAGEAVIFELFDEDTAGMRPGVLSEPRPQERVQRHTMEHIVDFVCFTPTVQILDAPVRQTVEQLPDVLRFFDRLMTVPEPVIEVPKIFTEDVPVRAVLRATQLAEQLVEVPTIISNPLLLLLQALLEQRNMEHNVDIPVPGGGGRRGRKRRNRLWPKLERRPAAFHGAEHQEEESEEELHEYIEYFEYHGRLWGPLGSGLAGMSAGGWLRQTEPRLPHNLAAAVAST